jgi:hypothetical protein
MVLLERFSITQGESLPESVIVAGRVVDNNAGGPEEGIPVFFGSRCHNPCLAAMTDAFGEFRFRVWLREEQRDPKKTSPSTFRFDVDLVSGGTRRPPLASPSVEDGTLYIGGRLDEHMELTSTATRAYSIKELLPKSKSDRGSQSSSDGAGQSLQNQRMNESGG